ncbi:hypothetical protein GGS23DRAFT_502072 [Durotheca rogersii]|uniref:uncharacterized protein n=1 Tax=Durotheca rogersii TaxID=419775 RepID=UPI00221E9903|nr:uncharacterized protein GGS23DRAFT_502072 [Durotheca rogersii]KAI5854082.1 hypothetical protein GGS23DRAFT_502072 [Durotheca rogersii]
MPAPPSGPSGAMPGDVGEIDDISLTSTGDEASGEDQDKEWFVDDLYAERPHPNRPGEMQYLIRWDGFPMDQCTWEPAENLGPGLLLQWEKTKKDIAAGKSRAFDIEIYNAAYRLRMERHLKRNAKRKRLGLPLTEPFSSESPIDGAVSPTTEGELDLDTKSDIKIDAKLKAKSNSRDADPQKAPSATALENPQATVGVARHVNKIPSKPTSPPPLQPKPSQRAALVDSGAKAAGSTTITGYQGTARKPGTATSLTSPRAGVGKTTQKRPNLPSKALLGTSSQPPKLSTSLANKFLGERLTATRSHPPPAAPAPVRRASNVFIGGKERKRRPGLIDAMVDPSKTPKTFHSLRVMNIAKKKAIEKSDNAPLDFASIPASFFLKSNEGDRPDANPAQSNARPEPVETSPLVQSPTEMSPLDSGVAAPVSKVKKSVRFIVPGDIEVADETMGGTVEVAHDTAVSAGEPGRAVRFSVDLPAVPKKLSLTTYQESRQTQVVSKTVVFGEAGSDPVKVVFDGITRQNQPWLPAFIGRPKLHFGTICAASNFVVQKSDLVGEILSAGAIEPALPDTIPALKNVIAHLRRGPYGCHLVAEEFSVLVYPPACDGWKGLSVERDRSNSESLQFMIYRSPVNPKLYPPASIPGAPAHPTRTEHGLHCRLLLRDFFGMDFSHMLPQESKRMDSQVFMLMFPEREAQVCNMVKLWLRSCQPNCRVFSLEIEDSWAKFHEVVRAGAAGTIILHEDMAATIRKIPRVFQMIDNKRCYTFWSLATGQYDPPRFPSNIDASIEPGTLQMTRLFPLGRAFLVTPSFALSDPVRLCEFLKWFLRYCANLRYLIVACANFPDYLKAITLEKERERHEFSSRHKDDPKLEDMLGGLGLRHSDIQARFEAWKLLNDIMQQFGDEETSEDIRKVEWITDQIDPNDEQSLVNWFCWWSSAKCDRYRKFTVLGSSVSRNKAAYRNIRLPVYTDETVSDPDIALAREDQKRRAREAVEEAESAKQFDPMPATSPESANSKPVFPRTVSQPSQGDRAVDFINWIAFSLRSRTAGWARLCGNPVSWLDVSMADHFGDPRCEFDTFKNWLGRAPKFFGRTNTWYGLFYTIDTEWNLNVPAELYGRHPWIAVVRPANPHLSKYYEKIQLFIWDLSAQDRENSRGHTSLLLDMQKHLVDVVREEITTKNKRYYLDQVYIASTTKLKRLPSETAVEFTRRRLLEMLDDGKSWLPPFDHLMSSVGWISLPKSEWQQGMTTKLAEAQSVQRRRSFPRHAGDEDKPQRLIWHAPRPKTQGEKSKCINNLYEAAFRVREKDGSRQGMRYQYKPTLEWYHDMKAEGRDSSQVNVDSADRILSRLRQKRP